MIREIYVLLKIKQSFTTPHHHETLGTVGRNYLVLNEYFLNFVGDNNWHEWIPYFVFAFNTTPNVYTTYKLFELVYGKLPRLPDDDLKNLEKIYNWDNYLTKLKIRHSFKKQET